MICTDLFQARPNGRTVVRFDFEYDRMLDAACTGGLDTSLAMSWPELLLGVEAGLEDGASGIGLAFSLEPDPKPELLRARDNLMIGWGASIFAELVGAFADPNPPCACGDSYQLPLLDGTGLPQECLQSQ